MANLYQLETTFDADTTIHTYTAPTSDIAAGQGAVEVQRKWRRKTYIGTGGYGIVWLEEEVGGKEQLRAVKRLPQAGNVNWSRELNILAQLRNHKDLFVEFFGWYEDERKDFVYFAMEYIEHGDLGQYLGTVGSEAMSQAKDIVTQILDGLVILHKERICHRDIKPNNILIASISPIQVKIADFGVSKNQENTSLYTRCGTSGYLAPELQGFTFKSGDSKKSGNPKKKGRSSRMNGSSKKNGPSYTNVVDIWSLGILTHKILTLEIPFLATDPESESEPESGLLPRQEPRQGHGHGQEQGQGQEQEQESRRIDLTLFLEYCGGQRTFPTESLQKSKVSSEGMEFVKALLVADPHFRMPADQALESPWLLNKSPEPYCSTSPSQIPLNDKAGEGVQKDEVQLEALGTDEIPRLISVKPSSTLEDGKSALEKDSSLKLNRGEAANGAALELQLTEEEYIIQAEVQRRLEIGSKEQRRIEKQLAELQLKIDVQKRKGEEMHARDRAIKAVLNNQEREAGRSRKRSKTRETEAEKAHREEMELIRKSTGLGEVGKRGGRYNTLDPRSMGYIPGFAESWSVPNGALELVETPFEPPPGTPGFLQLPMGDISGSTAAEGWNGVPMPTGTRFTPPPGTPNFPQRLHCEESFSRNTPLVEDGDSRRPPSTFRNGSTMVDKVLGSEEEVLERNAMGLEGIN